MHCTGRAKGAGPKWNSRKMRHSHFSDVLKKEGRVPFFFLTILPCGKRRSDQRQ